VVVTKGVRDGDDLALVDPTTGQDGKSNG
jgi:hypothetical protein